MEEDDGAAASSEDGHDGVFSADPSTADTPDAPWCACVGACLPACGSSTLLSGLDGDANDSKQKMCDAWGVCNS